MVEPRKTRIAVLVSGGGTNLQALIDAQGKVITDGEIVLVIANNSKAYALERAANAGIDSAVVLKKELDSLIFSVLCHLETIPPRGTLLR